jgi:alkanesulfonate monooxygenase SsuD/methylene tetrahydromethanopterin reductase-like flavin-dependent oxidoreductase (luciferase family)
MRIGLISDGNLRNAATPAEKIHQILDEAGLAEEHGFYCWGTSETHFSGPYTSITAPDAIYGAVAERTSEIMIRWMAMVITYAHPVQVAERLMTLDSLSNGRAGLCTARGNNINTVKTFNVEFEHSRPMWEESMRIIGRALQDERVNYDGEYWQLDDIPILPRPVQDPPPELLVVSSGVPTHVAAAKLGVGVISSDNYLGWEALDERIAAYRDTFPLAEPVAGHPTECFSYYVASAHCAETRQQALDEISTRAFEFVDFLLDELYAPLMNKTSYEYMEQIQAVHSYRRDLDQLMTIGPSIVAGDPDDVTATLKELERRGVDEVILSIDGISHEKHMKAIELIGKHVLPEFHRQPVGAPA